MGKFMFSVMFIISGIFAFHSKLI